MSNEKSTKVWKTVASFQTFSEADEKRKELAKLSILALAVAALLFAGNAQAQPIPEAPESTRKAAAAEILKKTPDAVLVYAKGLCCQSCGIGVRKKVGKLDFVDVFRFNTGVELHVQTQLATIAIKKGKKASAKALSKAIDDAGYAPVNLYKLKRGKLVVKSIALKK